MAPVTLAHAGFEGTFFVFDPVGLTLVAVLTAMYVRAWRVAKRRGLVVPPAQATAFALAVVVLAVAMLTPVDIMADSLASAHMVQHVLLADVAAPLLILGLRAPVLFFWWPAPVLKFGARKSRLRTLWSTLRRPRIALPIWIGLLAVWHVPALYEAALGSTAIHGVQHVSFVAGSVLFWWCILEPERARTPGAGWKLVYVGGGRMLGGLVGTVLLAWPSVLYPAYGGGPMSYGMSALNDQRLAGVIMMSVDLVIITVAILALLLRIDDDTPARVTRQTQTEVHA